MLKKLIVVFLSILLSICLTTCLLMYTPFTKWILTGLHLLGSPELGLIVAFFLLIGSIVFSIFYIQKKNSLFRLFLSSALITSIGCISVILGFLILLVTGDDNGCMFKDCAWFE